MANKIHVKKDDQVVVISGKDAGTIGKVIKTEPSKGRVYVEGANIVKKHQKARSQNAASGIIEREGSIDASNVMLVCPKCGKPTRVGHTFENGKDSKHGFLLSAKDICMLDRLKQLSDLGVVSLKIEGRARRPYYVAQACKLYRNALDGMSNSQEDLDALKVAFNRGYTPAYFDGNANIISKIQNALKIINFFKLIFKN